MLKQRIQSDATKALKQGNREFVGVLRLALASITSKEKEKRYKLSKENIKEEDLIKQSELTNNEVLSILSYEVKKRNDAISLYEKGNRPDLAEKERKEIEVLKKYLPEQLSQEELKKIVEESIKSVVATSVKDMGKVMADLMPKVKGKADGSEISKILKEILTK